MVAHKLYLNRKGRPMSQTGIAPAQDPNEEILDWDVPPIVDVARPSDRIPVRVRDAEPEPMLDP
jgi:hypothetical protein